MRSRIWAPLALILSHQTEFQVWKMFPNKKATLAALAIALSLTLTSGVEGRNASILVFGRSGSEVSSTVRMLLGISTPPEPAKTDSSNSSAFKSVITEFVVPIPGEFGSFLRIVEVEGVTDSPEEDAFVQASLKTFLTHPEGLNSQRPTAVLLVSPFDDFRYSDPQSSYVEMLRRISEVERSVFEDEIPDVNILLFTRLMKAGKSAQRSPKKKLESLKLAATFYVPGISQNIATLVGENKGGDSGLTLNEDGTFRLPNGQYYPANVFEAVANLPDEGGSSGNKDLVRIFTALRFNPNRIYPIAPTRVPFTVAPDSTDVDFFTRSILRSGLGHVDENEVNAALQATYESLTDVNLKRRIASSVPRLQRFFQLVNIRRLSDLPSTRLDSSKLFHSLPMAVNKDVVRFLREAINLTAPPFIESLTVGRGYDILRDEVLTAASVPFASAAMDSWEYSSWGHLLPTFVSCLQLPYNQVHFYIHFADTLEQSILQRQAYLHYPNKDALNISNFKEQRLLGFNVRSTDVHRLSAVKEFRTHKMQLNEKAELSEDFKDHVSFLAPFDSANRNSEKLWRSFFKRWGTHVVSSGFLGGHIQATRIGGDIPAAYQNPNEARSDLIRIFNFTRVDEYGNGVTFYSDPPDGNYNSMLTYYHFNPEAERNGFVDEWESSLSHLPEALDYQMELIPMSSLIGRANETIAQSAATALDLHLQGNLKYKRRI